MWSACVSREYPSFRSLYAAVLCTRVPLAELGRHLARHHRNECHGESDAFNPFYRQTTLHIRMPVHMCAAVQHMYFRHATLFIRPVLCCWRRKFVVINERNLSIIICSQSLRPMNVAMRAAFKPICEGLKANGKTRNALSSPKFGIDSALKDFPMLGIV